MLDKENMERPLARAGKQTSPVITGKMTTTKTITRIKGKAMARVMGIREIINDYTCGSLYPIGTDLILFASPLLIP